MSISRNTLALLFLCNCTSTKKVSDSLDKATFSTETKKTESTISGESHSETVEHLTTGEITEDDTDTIFKPDGGIAEIKQRHRSIKPSIKDKDTKIQSSFDGGSRIDYSRDAGTATKEKKT